MQTRDQHLQWCKDRALEYVEQGDCRNAAMSMLSDLRKFREPMYGPEAMMLINQLGMMEAMRGDPQSCRNWIEGCN